MSIAIIAGGLFFSGVLVIFFIVKKLIVVASPKELFVLSGRSHRYGSGIKGYRYISGGRLIRYPILEKLSVMSLATESVNLKLKNVYSKDGFPAGLEILAQFKISTNPVEIHNAIERFLEQPMSQIRNVFTETLEGAVRSACGNLKADEIKSDREYFMQTILDEAHHNFSKLGLTVEYLTVNTVQVIKERNQVNSNEAPF